MYVIGITRQISSQEIRNHIKGKWQQNWLLQIYISLFKYWLCWIWYMAMRDSQQWNMVPLRSTTLVVVCVMLHKFVCCVLQKWQKLGDVLYMWHHSKWSNALHNSNHAVLYKSYAIDEQLNLLFWQYVLLLKAQHFSHKYCRDWKCEQLSSHWGCWSMRTVRFCARALQDFS